MKIELKYESSWCNSFLDGSNNEPLPKQKNGHYRKFVASMKSLNDRKQNNYISRSISHDTVMGVLNRLLGDQRKLYQARSHNQYFFKDIEALITFEDKPSAINHEMIFLRNVSGSTDQNAYTGMVKVDDPIFCSDYSSQLWGVLDLTLDSLCDFILNQTKVYSRFNPSPLIIMSLFEAMDKIKPLPNEGPIKAATNALAEKYSDFNGLDKNGLVAAKKLYCCALYVQLERLGQEFDVSSAKTQRGGLSGISKNMVTKKDFMARYTTGDRKKIWGNPYIRREKIKGIGEEVSMMQKASGTLVINININRSDALDFKTKIENAGVSSFYLGKKGLAYVSDIRI